MEIKYFGSRYTKQVADYCSSIEREPISLLTTYVDDDEGVLIFPILGDNRIPNEVSSFLANPDISLPSILHVLIVGDHDLDIYKNQKIEITNEIVALLKVKNSKLIKNPLLVDTPNINYEAIQNWLNESSSPVQLFQKPEIIVPEQLEQLVAFLGDVPRFKIVADYIVDLKFYSYDPYPKPLITDQTNWRILNAKLSQMPQLERLSFAYCELSTIPLDKVILSNLVELDIRNTNLKSFDFLSETINLTFLNISALGLEHFPSEVWALRQLISLYAYKNNIESIPNDISNLLQLKKLSLYRNKITMIDTLPDKLEHVNIGGNPIQQICSHKQLKSLSIRHCNFRKLPFDLSDFPNLQRLDVYKNDLKIINEFEHLIDHL